MSDDIFPLAVTSRLCANGRREWFFTVDEEPVYPNAAINIGLFLDPSVQPPDALRAVVEQWMAVLS